MAISDKGLTLYFHKDPDFKSFQSDKISIKPFKFNFKGSRLRGNGLPYELYLNGENISMTITRICSRRGDWGDVEGTLSFISDSFSGELSEEFLNLLFDENCHAETIELGEFDFGDNSIFCGSKEEIYGKYKGFFYVLFDHSPDECFGNEAFRLKLEENRVFMDYSFDWPRMFILFKDLTMENFIKCFKIKEYLNKVNKEIVDVERLASETLINNKKYWEAL